LPAKRRDRPAEAEQSVQPAVLIQQFFMMENPENGEGFVSQPNPSLTFGPAIHTV
jgi:hypothetical protein